MIEGVGKDAQTVTNEQGGKQSQVLYRFDLMDPKAMFEMAKVLQIGAAKYGDDNWQKISVQEHLNHLLIHAYAYLAGDTSDEHLSHIMCRALFAQAVEIQKENTSLAADIRALDKELTETKATLEKVWSFAKNLENEDTERREYGKTRIRKEATIEKVYTDPERDTRVIDKAVSVFAEEMKQKLLANGHKKHWKRYGYEFLLMRLKEERDELIGAIRERLSVEEVIEECADVANFAMFIADNTRNGVNTR